MGNSKDATGRRVFNDVYSFPQDSQDLADDIWANGNVKVGPSSERQSFPTAQTKPGMLWVESDSGLIYRHNGSGWVNTMIEDTGWQTATGFINGFSSSTSTDTVRYRRLNGVTYLKGGLLRGSAPAGVIAFGIPVGFRPGAQLRMAMRPELGLAVVIEVNGAVTITANASQPGPGGVGYSLTGISFIAEG